MTLGKFYLRLAAFSALMAVFIKSAQLYFYSVTNDIWLAYAFLVILTLAIYTLSARSLRMSIKNSMSIILGGMMFRMLITLFYIIIYWFSVNKDFRFIGAFLCLYLFFTVFEIYHLVANLRPDSKKQ